MQNGGPGADCPDRAFQSCVEVMLSRLTEVELEQVILSLGAEKEEIDVLSSSANRGAIISHYFYFAILYAL